ncbi:AAA family ATPase [Streptomyces sp.]|uniref:nSTAND1 domain-containing NTPase n=1 Tax=Streptomyces sp. TaxID=1931 RepID=UPI002D781BA8|nr:AAA family ATPase [Streptomyces sp.]HET6358021.1 AAA family ATPase [Streptomyces sp.]
MPPDEVSAGLLDEEQWRHWLRAARASPPDPAPRQPAERGKSAGQTGPVVADGERAPQCPYRGLTPFGQEQADIFYGRENLTAQLVQALADRHDRPGILLVSGASGAGKSSLVRAGLLPALSDGALSAESATWPVAVMHPTSQPRDELARVLAKVAGRDPGAFRTALERAPERAHTLVRDVVDAYAAKRQHAASSTGDRLVLVVDPLEQLFTLADASRPDPGSRSGVAASVERERADVIAALHAAATVPCGPDGEPAALVIAVVRSDYLPACAAYPQLAQAATDGLFLVGPMTAAQLRATITGPAEHAGLDISPSLVDVILAELPTSSPDGGYEVGALPLLSEAMRVTWKHREGNRLTGRGYELSGGVVHAIQTSADAVYTTLSSAQQAVARKVFHRLTKVTPDGQAVRRPMPYRHDEPALEVHDVRDVVEAFAAQRLIVVGENTAQITHDTLLHSWGRLRGWLEDDPANRALYSQLADDAADWARNDHHASYLYRGQRLTAVNNAQHHWKTDPDRYPTLTEQEHGFLNSSLQAQSRATRWRHALTTALTILLALAVTAASIAYDQRRAALSAKHQAQSRELAVRSGALIDIDPDLASLLAVLAYKTSPTTEATASLYAAAELPLHRRLTGDESRVMSLAFSRDSRTLATGNLQGTVRLRDRATGRTLRTLRGHTDRVSWIAFSPDGRTLATAGDDDTVRLWDLATGRIRRTLTGHTNDVWSLAFSPDGQTLASSSKDATVRLWDLATGRIRRTLTDHRAAIWRVAFSPDGRTLATAGDDGTVRLRDPESGNTRTTLTGHKDGVWSVAFSPDGQTLATGSKDATVRLWDTAGRNLKTFTGHTEGVWSVVFSPDGRTLATAGEDATVLLWDRTTGRTHNTFTGYKDIVAPVAFSPDGRTLATATRFGAVRLLDTVGRTRRTLTGPKDDVRSVTLSPDGHTLATASDDGTVRLRDLATGRTRRILTGHKDGVWSVAFSPDGQTLATATKDGTVRLWDTAGRNLQTFTGHTSAVWSVAFSPDGHTLATSSADGTIRLWDRASGRNLQTLTSMSIPLGSVAFSPDGHILATTDGLGRVRLRDPDTGNTRTNLTGHKEPVGSLAFSPDGRTLATGSDDGTIRLWDLATGRTRRILTGHKDDVWSVVFSPDSHTLASISKDATVRLWDTDTDGAGMILTSNDENAVASAAFSPDGHTLVTGSDDGTVRVWDAKLPDHLEAIKKICQSISRELTATERSQFQIDQSRRACAS